MSPLTVHRPPSGMAKCSRAIGGFARGRRSSRVVNLHDPIEGRAPVPCVAPLTLSGTIDTIPDVGLPDPVTLRLRPDLPPRKLAHLVLDVIDEVALCGASTSGSMAIVVGSSPPAGVAICEACEAIAEDLELRRRRGSRWDGLWKMVRGLDL